ncbi:MAG: DNA polymerase III subunit alpha [Actinomycetota bacterium]|nr:DNA polymerase III subunit alpha [Actinomycetota bacterium]
MDPFVHLHVASGYSLRYGASHPATLVARAAEHGMGTLALTDRDGFYGAVKFATACRSAGIRPLFGVDLALRPAAHPALRVERPEEDGRLLSTRAPPTRASPARGGISVDPRLPRVTLLAATGRGWASLARLISATHLGGERGTPVSSLELIAEHAEGVLVLLGPDSEVGRALAGKRPDLAKAHLNRWREALSRHQVFAEVVHHRARGDRGRAAAVLDFAAEHRLPAVLTNAVRYADARDAPIADVLDSARRLVPLDARHIDRRNAEGYLKSGKQMTEVAEEVVGPDREATRRLLAATRRVADRCAVDPRTDLGIGQVHFPELSVVRRPGEEAASAREVLRLRCEAGLGRRAMTPDAAVRRRLDDELEVIGGLGYPSYFLTVADVTDLIRSMGVRVAARGSGAGSLVNYLLGISDVDPIRHKLLMERFLSPLREALPDIDIDVESARRMEVYDAILDRFGADRCTCVSMMDTYRVRHAVRDVGAALGMPPGEIDTIAKAFPHIRANQVKAALRDLPELQTSGLGQDQLRVLFDVVERLDGLPRHIALHPCGVLLSDTTLLDRTPVEASYLGYPMSQFDKDDVEELGLLKLDVVGIRMQSAMAHAMTEVQRVDGHRPDVDSAPLDDPATYALIQSTRTLGCFQIESPGQRELVGKFSPENFMDLIIDISLFRPGPVKSDMVTPFLLARQGWNETVFPHEDLAESLGDTYGVVVFHEQVLEIVSVLTGVSLAEADEVRRALGEHDAHAEVKAWFIPAALAKDYPLTVVERAWEVLAAFASFGFCKAHAAAFALPTYQSAWLKAHHTAAFLAGVLTHDPGMYPKRLILDDARNFGIAVLPLDVNVSDECYRVERAPVTDEPPDGEYGIRLSLTDVKGITEAEVQRIVAGRPYATLSDFWQRAGVTRPVVERLVLAGGFDAAYDIGPTLPVRRRSRITRRDLLLQVAELDAWTRATARADRALTPRKRSARRVAAAVPEGLSVRDSIRAAATRQSQAIAAASPQPMQLALDLSAEETDTGQARSGLPELTDAELVRAELEILGLDASRHVVDFYVPFLDALGVIRARDVLGCRSKAEILVAGVKVATQTPPVRSGRRVVFVTLDDATGPVDATFFEDAQGPYAMTVFHSWLLVIRGIVRRTGRRGVSLRATGCWELPGLREIWEAEGMPAVWDAMRTPGIGVSEQAMQGAADSYSARPVIARPVLVHPSGFRMSPYADLKPPGEETKTVPRKLWHASPGSSGH